MKYPKSYPYIYIWAQKIIFSWEETKKTWAPVGVVVIDHEEEKVADEQFIRLAELTKVIKSSKNRRLILREAKIRLSHYGFVSLQRG